MLSIVIGNLDLAKGSLHDNEKALRRVENAIEGAHRCAELTSRLLAFSRRSPLQRGLWTSRASSRPDQAPRAHARRADHHLGRTRRRAPEICVDHAQFEAALINLAVNARDAMPEGGTLFIRVQGRDAPATEGTGCARCVDITVTDTGTGMPPAILAGCFEPFFTTKEAGKGTGLGLSMVYGFVQQSGGTITVDSTPGQGTRFVVTLPALDRPIIAAEGIGRRALHDATNAVNGAGRVVLVVEDDADVRSTITSTLEALAFTVLSAQDGNEALRLLESERNIALVFSDVNMPGPMTASTWDMSSADNGRRCRSF